MGERSLLKAVGFIHEINKLDSGSHSLKISIATRDVKEGDIWKTIYIAMTVYTKKDFEPPVNFEKVPFDLEIEGLMIEKRETEKGTFVNTSGYLKSISVKQHQPKN
ncbi:TPA: hypothetical protein ACIFCT_003560 [Acinetobacter baumannii]|uniref:Uncharacterized protein n=2 Tax=Acinetobacter calcoaceticus/baumannii complex TaxID=909768 RepID=A0A646LUL2_ACIBA|nr:MULTISPECIES: hypothetical protein [Acinetobacter calcoaceticus/baumannii complex]EHU3033149.1 hypothetical protein [Acinetobacter baumannii]EHZ7962102.1 hypothetical protein [Acinetobacter baumannii]EIB7144055.1 hypothetical protein [Acinetobacter baumannii]EKA78387.1 hypothetical protein ACINIS58_A0060 [Acinetobacter baumannii IS-58]EKK06743.1 hypothetical protein ACINIS235_A0091 [Acinetobacter baumannii IS-235]